MSWTLIELAVAEVLCHMTHLTFLHPLRLDEGQTKSSEGQLFQIDISTRKSARSRLPEPAGSTTMATTTMTMTATSKKKGPELAPESERFLRCCADVASALIEDHEATKSGRPSRDINLNSLRSKLAKKHKLANIPPLTAIIAAIPEHYKKYILPKLIAKPISMDGVLDLLNNSQLICGRNVFWNRCCRRHVQAT